MEQQSVNGSGLSDQEKESCLEKGERIARLEKAREHHPNTNGSEPAKEDTLIGILEGKDPALEQELADIRQTYSDQLAHIDKDIIDVEAELREVDIVIKDVTKALKQQFDSIDIKEKELKKLVDDLYTLVKNLGTKKAAVITQKIANFQAALEASLKANKETEDKYNAKLKADHDARKPEFDDWLKDLEKDIKDAEIQVTKVTGVIEAMGHLKLNAFMRSLFLTIASIAIVISGNLLEAYLVNGPKPVEDLVANSVLSQVIKGIAGLSLNWNAWQIGLGLLAFGALNFAVAWICEALLFKRIIPRLGRLKVRRKKGNDGADELTIEDTSHIEQERARIKSRSWSSVVLHYIPILFFMIMTVVLLTGGANNIKSTTAANDSLTSILSGAGNDSLINALSRLHGGTSTATLTGVAGEPQEPDDHYARMTRQALGSVMTILFAGILLMYIKFLAVPRFFKRNKGKITRDDWHTTFLMKWEIVVVVGMMLLFFASLSAYAWFGPSSQRFFILTGFIGSAFTGAVLLAWSYYSYSLAMELNNAETVYNELKVLRSRMKHAPRISLNPRTRLYEVMQEGLNELDKMMLKDIDNTQNMWKQRVPWLRNPRRYFRLRNGKIGWTQDEWPHLLFNLESLVTVEELACYPELEKEYLILQTKIREVASTLHDLKEEEINMNIGEDGKLNDKGAAKGVAGKAEQKKEALTEKLEGHYDRKRDKIKQREQAVRAAIDLAESRRSWVLKGYYSYLDEK